MTLFTFLLFTGFVAFYATWKLRRDWLRSRDGYFLGGRSLTGIVIAGSLLLTNISTEHLVGMNGSAYKNGAIIIAWEVTSAIALVIAALYFAPRYLKMGLTTIPEFLEKRFDGFTRTLVALLLIISFVVTLLPIVLYTGALNIEAIFEISDLLNVSQREGIWMTILVVGGLGAVYAIFGGLKMKQEGKITNIKEGKSRRLVITVEVDKPRSKEEIDESITYAKERMREYQKENVTLRRDLKKARKASQFSKR